MSDDFTRPTSRPSAPDVTALAPPGSTPAPDGTVPGGVEAARPFADYPVVPGYAVTGELGRGGMGWVLTATDLRFGRDVAVKLPLPGLATDHACKLFVHEAVITGRLAHPGIPPAHHLGALADGTPFLAMKLVRGRTLAALLAERPDPAHDQPRFVGVFEQVCQAVGYAHDQGVLHRDLKPGNVMVGAFGEVQVMDWGLALAKDEGGRMKDEAGPRPVSDSSFILPPSSFDVVGTPAYMAPEQARGERVDAAADVFALGGMLASILVGRPPFWADQASSTLEQAAAGDTADVLAALAGCGADAELIDIARRCLAADRPARPADGTAVARLVAAHRAGVEERLRAAERDRAAAETRAVEQRKRRGVELVLAAALLVLVTGGGAVAVWRVHESAEDERRAADARAEQARADAEGERRVRAERDRTVRAETAVADLLDAAEAALRADAADRAALLLDQAARRAADDGLTEPAARLAADARALTVLRELDRIDGYRWTPLGPRYPSPQSVAREWEAALAAYGVVPSTSPTAADVARLTNTPVRAALLAALDGWLGRVPTEPVRALLAAADPDPFRTEVRRLMAAQDAAGLAALADRPEWAAQPAGLVEAYAAEAGVPVEVRRRLLTRVAAARPDDFGVLMDLGATYPLNAAAAERARWFQAAVALRPGSAPARLSLGSALRVADDPDGAVAAFREAARLDPTDAAHRNGLGLALEEGYDFAGAEAAFREAARLDPRSPLGAANLGHVLRKMGRTAEAADAFRAALAVRPDFPFARAGLEYCLRVQRGEVPAAPPPRAAGR